MTEKFQRVIGAWWKIFPLLARLFIYGLLYEAISRHFSRPAFPCLKILLGGISSDFFIELFENYPATLLRWFVVFLFGTALGVLFGIILGAWRKLHSHIQGDIDFWRSLPATVLVTFSLAAFGDGDVSRGLPTFYITFFTVLFYVAKSVESINKVRIDHLLQLGASYYFVFINCLVFEIMAPIAIAVRQTLSLSFLVTISVELIVGPANNTGLGGILYDWQFNQDYEKILLCLVVIGFTGYLINVLGHWAHRKIIFWEAVEQSFNSPN